MLFISSCFHLMIMNKTIYYIAYTNILSFPIFRYISNLYFSNRSVFFSFSIFFKEIMFIVSQLIKNFITAELMRWPLIQHLFGEMLRKTHVFLLGDEAGEKRWEELHNRV